MDNDPIAQFAQLAERANQEPEPNIDIANRVVVSLKAQSTRPTRVRQESVLIGTGSFVAASAASLVFWFAVADDSLLPLVQPFITMLP